MWPMWSAVPAGAPQVRVPRGGQQALEAAGKRVRALS